MCLQNSDKQMLLSHGEKIEICKTFKHGSAYLTQLEYIINLLFRIAQPFNAKRSKDNIAEFLTKRREKTKVMT